VLTVSHHRAPSLQAGRVGRGDVIGSGGGGERPRGGGGVPLKPVPPAVDIAIVPGVLPEPSEVEKRLASAALPVAVPVLMVDVMSVPPLLRA